MAETADKTTEKIKKQNEWPEVRRAFDGNRYELNLIGAEVSARLDENDGKLDPNLFKLKNLNLLEVAKTSLKLFPKEIHSLANLTTLIFHSNQLVEVAPEIGKLPLLSHLDLSNNKLTSLPDEMKNLVELRIVNLSGNELTALFPLAALGKLAVLTMSRNKFQKLPEDMGLASLELLREVDFSFNELKEIHEDLTELHSLKYLNLEHNQINHVPANVSQCTKLKDLLLKDNKLKDNRLKKLIEQDKLKAVMDYLEKEYVEECKKAAKKPKAKTPKTKKTTEQSETKPHDTIKIVKYDGLSMDDKIAKEIYLDQSVAAIRPYILCCIVRNLDLKSNNNLKSFLSLQNKLHEDSCQKRSLATIATHDLKLTIGDLFYRAVNPSKSEFVPLGRTDSVSPMEYYEKLYDEAEAERKAKKRNQLSGLYKYLNLLDTRRDFPVLEDSEKRIISLPPLTNSEKTRMTADTKDILIEITSNTSVDACRKIMEELLLEMLKSGFGAADEKKDDTTLRDLIQHELHIEDPAPTHPAPPTDNPQLPVRNSLVVQQVRVLDFGKNVVCVYPTSADLKFTEDKNIKLIRYDEV